MGTTVGIIGAGQLGVYLCQAATAMGLSTVVMSSSPSAPAVQIADKAVIGDFDDLEAVQELCGLVDVVTYEFEDVPQQSLDELSRIASTTRLQVFPDPSVLSLLKNKATQKTWLREQEFPTGDFHVCDQDTTVESMTARFGLPFVQKSQTGGFDGRGVQIINNGDDERFWDTPSIVEQWVNHQTELAVIVARSTSGACVSYPVVEMTCSPTNQVLELATSPASISPDIEQQARALGERIVAALGSVGLFAIELFLTNEGQILVNEISPRVHNSGHLTIEAHQTSQYTQHLLAITGQELGDTQQINPAAMSNILYEDRMIALCGLPVSRWQHDHQTVVHWYGKTKGSLGRKMGHITSVTAQLDEAKQLALTGLASLSKATPRVL
jgi:5-(carboxyamino)imidazole ribonucleotide synthase